MRATTSVGTAHVREQATAPGVAALFATHHARLVRVAWLLVRDAGRAEELVQDAFVDLHQRWSSLRDPQDAAGYLHVSVVNRSRSALRHQHVVRATPAEAGPDEESAETGALRALERQRVLAGLDQLSRRQREVLVLRYYAGLTEAATAGVLGISQGSVMKHGARGVAALRPLLGDIDED